MEKFYKVGESELLDFIETWHRCNILDDYWTPYDIGERFYINKWHEENPDAGDDVDELWHIAAYELKRYTEVD